MSETLEKRAPGDKALELAREIEEQWFCEIKGDWQKEVCENAVAALLRPHVQEWISVEEIDKLPANGTSVLISYGDGPWITSADFEWGYDNKPMFGLGTGKGFAWNVTHWQPLPPAPVERTKENK
jgi:Protein of unknown function (DUF551)